MGDRNNDTVDENIDEQEENVDEQEQDDTGSDDNKDEEENEDEDETDEEDDAGEEDDKDKKSDKNKEEDDDDEDEQPPVRKGKMNWARINRKEFFSKKQKESEKDQQKGEDDADEEDDDDIAPEDEAMVDKVIRKRYGSKFDQLDEKADEGEVKDFVADNPQFKPYQKKILRFLKDPSRSHLPVKTIAYEVAGDDLMKLGAKKGKQADIQSRKRAGGGHSTSKTSGGKSTADMSDEEFDAEVERVKHSQNN